MLAERPGVGQLRKQEKSGSDDGGGLQTEGPLAQAHRTPAGGEELAPLGRIEPPLGADQEGV